MAELLDELWKYNLARVVVIDVSDDYRLMQPPLPSIFYPVLNELWLPRHQILQSLPGSSLVEGYLYDWHESPPEGESDWFVGVVSSELVHQLVTKGMSTTSAMN